MWLIVRRSSCTWLVDTNNILINDELCTPYVHSMYYQKRSAGRKKERKNRDKKNGWAVTAQPAVCTEYVWTVVCTVRILPLYMYTVWSDCSTRRPPVWKFQTRWNQWRWQIDNWHVRLDLGVRFNYLTNSTKLLFDASVCTRALHTFSQPASQSVSEPYWMKR